jgi:hypothetical protein
MATKPSKSTKTSLVAKERVIVSDLKVKDPDTKYYGAEPLFAIQPDNRSLALGLSFNWYSRFCSTKDAKDFLVMYVDQTGTKDTAKLLARVEEREVMPTLGWLARLHLRGLDLSAEERIRLNNEINRLIESIAKPKLVSPTAAPEKEEVPVAARPNVQEIMRERTREVAGEIEGWLDDFIISGAKPANIDINSVGIMTERNIMPQHVPMLTEIWKRKLAEFEEVLEGRDRQLVEAYSHYSKAQLKAVVKFCEAVLASFSSYLSVKKASAAPRKRKAVSPEKQASKMKYQKVDETLKLTSVSPAKIIGASEVWAYDTAKRKLHYYVADSHIGTMGIKGTTIIGFDAVKSGIKTLRKPAEVLKKLMAGGKPASRKVFTEVNAVQAIPNGRTSDNLIILKAY